MRALTTVPTRTLDEYLAVALSAHEAPGETFPVYDPEGRHLWPRRVSARLGIPVVDPPTGEPRTDSGATPEEAEAVLRHAREDHLVVAVPGRGKDEGYAWPAAVFALAKRARLERAYGVEDVLRAVRRAGSPRWLTIVGPSDALGFGWTARIREARPELDVGLLCAQSVVKLGELVFKALAHPRLPAARDVFVAPLLKGDAPVAAGRLTTYPQDAVDAAALTDGTGLHRVFSLITHGSEDYMRLGSGDILCGLTPDESAREAAVREGGPLPACLQGDGCVYPEARRRDPARVPAQVVFANACLTVKLGTQLLGRDNRFTVAQRFLDAWAGSYVASPLLKDGTPAENLLFHHLLDEGLPLGTAVRVVNDNLRRWGVDAPEVVIIGDPEATYAPEPATVAPPSVTCHEEPGRARIVFEGVVPARTRIRLKDPDLLAGPADGLTVTPLAPFGGRQPVYCATGVIDGEPNLFVLALQDHRITGPHTSRTLVLERTTGRGAAPGPTAHGSGAVAAAHRIVRAIERYENLAFLDLRLDRTRNILADAANSLPTIARRVKAVAAEPTRSEPLEKATDRILANCRRLDRNLLEMLLRLTETREYHFVEAYRPVYAVRHVDSPYGVCDYCGEVLHRYVSAHVLRPHLRRHLLSCPVCGATQDTEDDAVRIAIRGDNRLQPGTETVLDVRMDNDGDEPLEVLLGARITRGKPHGFGFRLDPDTLTVPPRAAARTRLTVTTGEPSIHHPVLLRFYAVGLGRIDFAGRDLWIRKER